MSEYPLEPLGSICEINPETLTEASDPTRRYRYIDLSSIKEQKADLSITPSPFMDLPSRARRKVTFNDVLLGTVRPNLKNFAIIESEDEDLLCSTGFAVLRSKANASDPRFIFHVINSEIVARQLNALVTGSNYPAVNATQVGELLIPVPPLPEQKKIAEILSGVERTISQTSQRIEKHKTLLLATLEEIFDYLGGKADLRPLGDCCRHILDFRGRTPAKLGMEWGSGTIRALSANNVRDGFIDFNRECYLGSESLYRNWMTKGDCERGDIVFTMEAPMGNVAIIPDDEKYILSQRVVLLSPDRQQILPEYLYWFMRSSRFRSDCENLATGTTAKGIKQANLITIGVPIATLEEQAKAVQLPTSMERLITSEEQRLLQLNLIKQSLSADLLSGRKRVRV